MLLASWPGLEAMAKSKGIKIDPFSSELCGFSPSFDPLPHEGWLLRVAWGRGLPLICLAPRALKARVLLFSVNGPSAPRGEAAWPQTPAGFPSSAACVYAKVRLFHP